MNIFKVDMPIGRLKYIVIGIIIRIVSEIILILFSQIPISKIILANLWILLTTYLNTVNDAKRLWAISSNKLYSIIVAVVFSILFLILIKFHNIKSLTILLIIILMAYYLILLLVPNKKQI